MIELTRPYFLALALVVPLLVWMMRRSLADLTPAQRSVCFVVRTIILLLVALALAGLRWMLPSRDLAVIFAVDDSASISEPARKAAREFVAAGFGAAGSSDHTGVVGFADGAELWQPPSPVTKLAESWPTLANRRATDVGRAPPRDADDELRGVLTA